MFLVLVQTPRSSFPRLAYSAARSNTLEALERRGLIELRIEFGYGGSGVRYRVRRTKAGDAVVRKVNGAA